MEIRHIHILHLPLKLSSIPFQGQIDTFQNQIDNFQDQIDTFKVKSTLSKSNRHFQNQIDSSDYYSSTPSKPV